MRAGKTNFAFSRFPVFSAETTGFFDGIYVLARLTILPGSTSKKEKIARISAKMSEIDYTDLATVSPS